MVKCIIDGCDKKSVSIKHGLCYGHRQHLYKKGNIENRPLRKKRTFESAKLIINQSIED